MINVPLKRQVGSYKVLPEKYLQPGFRNSVEKDLERKLGNPSVKYLKNTNQGDIDTGTKQIQNLIDPFDFNKEYFTLGDLMAIDFKSYPFLLEHFIPKYLISVFSADNGLGKSTWYSELAIAITSGKTEIWGLKLNPKFKSVLVVSTEDTALLLADRFNAQLKGKKVSKDMKDQLRFYTGNSDIIEVLDTKLKAFNSDLVVIDAYYDVYKGNPFLPTDTRAFFNSLSSLIEKYKCSILIVTHDVKGGDKRSASKTKVSGSGAIVDKARSVFTMIRANQKPNLRYMKVIKTNVTRDDSDIKIALNLDPVSRTFSRDYDNEKVPDSDSVNSGHQATEESSKSKPGRKIPQDKLCLAFKLHDEGLSLEKIGERVGRSKSVVSGWLRKKRPICDEDDLFKEAIKKNKEGQ